LILFPNFVVDSVVVDANITGVLDKVFLNLLESLSIPESDGVSLFLLFVLKRLPVIEPLLSPFYAFLGTAAFHTASTLFEQDNPLEYLNSQNRKG